MANLAERQLDGYDRTIRIDRVTRHTLLVSVVTPDNQIEWAERTQDGKEALLWYYHPFACGYKKEGK